MSMNDVIQARPYEFTTLTLPRALPHTEISAGAVSQCRCLHLRNRALATPWYATHRRSVVGVVVSTALGGPLPGLVGRRGWQCNRLILRSLSHVSIQRPVAYTIPLYGNSGIQWSQLNLPLSHSTQALSATKLTPPLVGKDVGREKSGQTRVEPGTP